MNIGRIRGFLLQAPKPSLVRVFIDGEPEELKVKGTYQKLAESIAALQAEQIQCLDSEGKILRAMRLDDAESQRSDAAPIPAGLQTDPHALMLTHFANLIHRAYEHSTEIAFTRMVDMTDRLNERSISIEQRLERAEAYARRLREEQADEALDRAEEIAESAGANGADLGTQLASAFLSGQLQQPAKPNGAPKPNGVHKSNGKGGAA